MSDPSEKNSNYPPKYKVDSLTNLKNPKSTSQNEQDSTIGNIQDLSKTTIDKDKNCIIDQYSSDRKVIQNSSVQVHYAQNPTFMSKCDLDYSIPMPDEHHPGPCIMENEINPDQSKVKRDLVSDQAVPKISTQLSQSAVKFCASNKRKQRKEIYVIKKISWSDNNDEKKSRVSPILIQNANGPCPLLALVNALTLSTPANLNTPLVDTLRSREQISLGLLLDAVFDELTSGRHSDATNELPDVTDLYSFLVTLHTGMNVNPCFFPTAPIDSNEENLSHKNTSNGRFPRAGSFEKTREMRLYSTFGVDLIHGWLPECNSPESAALFRSARTYEDAQNAMLAQEFLEANLSEGLNLKEQTLLEDILHIKAFLASNPTQLTPHGLDAIRSSLAPGTVAIFFRNNHFSTVYRHPRIPQILQLVTDIGYAKNDRIVWESLMDVTGNNSQFYSGDLQLLSGNPTAILNPLTYTSNLANREIGRLSEKDLSSSFYTKSKYTQSTEQEDQDLALAILLQEEEQQSHQSVMNQRCQREESSEREATQPDQRRRAYNTTGGPANNSSSRIGCDNGPTIPPRRKMMSRRNRLVIRSGVNIEAGVDSPPPSYEVAATEKPYVPPNIHPSNLSSNLALPYCPRSSSSDNQNINNGRQSRADDQTLTPYTEMRSVRNLAPSQANTEKVVSGQERGQRECTLM